MAFYNEFREQQLEEEADKTILKRLRKQNIVPGEGGIPTSRRRFPASQLIKAKSKIHRKKLREEEEQLGITTLV